MKLLAIDMDGTCLDSHNRLPDQTFEALQAASEAGITVVPTTGRSLSCIPHRLKEHPFYRYVITSNGAQVTDLKTNKSIFQALIPKELAASVLSSCRRQRIGLASHINQEYLIQGTPLTLLGRLVYGKDTSNVYTVKNMSETILQSEYDVEELQLYFFSRSAPTQVKEILKQFPEIYAAYTSAYVEIFSQKASKGTALSALASYLGIFTEEIACIGDSENDLSMFRASGMKFAVGNAIPELKAQADHILPSNNQNGVAEAVRKYLLCA